MERWILYALVSMFFAGFTSVIAKQGLQGISAELGLTIRTCFVFVLILGFAALAVSRSEFQLITSRNLWWLGLSGVTTAISWVFYYKALHQGEVATVALIDKGSFVVAVALAWMVLGEPISFRALGSMVLIGAGLVVASWK